LRAGHFEIVPPVFKEIEANGQRLHIERGCAPTTLIGPLP
jgi:hypothetical protein